MTEKTKEFWEKKKLKAEEKTKLKDWNKNLKERSGKYIIVRTKLHKLFKWSSIVFTLLLILLIILGFLVLPTLSNLYQQNSEVVNTYLNGINWSRG